MTNIIGVIPQQLQNGTPDDASQVMANFNYIAAQVNAKAAGQGANADITSLSALVTPLSPSQGGSSFYYASVVGGTANAISVSGLTPSGFVQQAGNKVAFIPQATCTGATTLQVAGGAATSLLKQTALGLQPLGGNEVVLGQMAEAMFDGTNFVLLTGLAAPYDAPIAAPSAAMVDLGLLPSNSATITGSVAITSFGSSADLIAPVYRLVFAGVTTITYNAMSLITPSGYNIQTHVGDSAIALYLGSGNWRIIGYESSNALVSLVGGYRNKKMQVASVSTAAITAAAITLEDASGFGVRLNNFSATINTSTAGLNGLDTGAVAASQWYYAFAVYNPTTLANGAIVSLSSTAPALPAGFAMSAYIGALRTDASAHLVTTLQTNTKVSYVGTPPVIASGYQLAITAYSTAAFIPSTATAFGVLLDSFGVYNGYSIAAGVDSVFLSLQVINNNSGDRQAATFANVANQVYYQQRDNSAYGKLYITGWEEPQ